MVIHTMITGLTKVGENFKQEIILFNIQSLKQGVLGQILVPSSGHLSSPWTSCSSTGGTTTSTTSTGGILTSTTSTGGITTSTTSTVGITTSTTSTAPTPNSPTMLGLVARTRQGVWTLTRVSLDLRLAGLEMCQN